VKLLEDTLRSRWLALSVAIFSIIGYLACTEKRAFDFDRIPSEKAQLLEGIDSYQSRQQFETFLSQRGVRVEADATRGTFVMLTVASYKHLNCDGRLEATFVFDRLMAVTFVPSDDSKYSAALANLGIKLKQSDDIILRGRYTKVRSGHEGNARFYQWVDTRLEDGWNDWAERHSG
jgi:hypothetical protein